MKQLAEQNKIAAQMQERQMAQQMAAMYAQQQMQWAMGCYLQFGGAGAVGAASSAAPYQSALHQATGAAVAASSSSYYQSALHQAEGAAAAASSSSYDSPSGEEEVEEEIAIQEEGRGTRKSIKTEVDKEVPKRRKPRKQFR